MKRIVTIIMALTMAFSFVLCGCSARKSAETTEDILECISKGNAKARTGIDLIADGSATDYEGLYEEECRAVDLLNEAKSYYEDAIEICGDDEEYGTLKNRLQNVINSIPSKPVSMDDSAFEHFGAEYDTFVNAVANMEAERKTFSEDTGYIVTDALGV
ncbi:MAG: hypothetical protein IJ655_10520 [Lachnospiraceae bacterium]|nr:hypothetical protein [Lachnospiraceae bacterium]MBR1573166.1 hypothetical protein [Lachnospiraceae bacterium]